MENNEEYVTISLQGYTKQSGLNRGRSPRYSVLNDCLEGSTSPLVKNMLRSDWRLVFNCFAKPEKGLFPVYRLEEDVVLLKEGAVRLSLWC